MADEQKEPMTRERATKLTGEVIRWLRTDAERHNEVAESIERGFPMKMVYGSICDISRCWANALQYLLDENERLRQVLQDIADHQPAVVEVPEDLGAEIEGCPKCKLARERKWPPSGLCDHHYSECDKRVWSVNDRARQYQHLDLKRIARGALETATN